MSKQHSRQVFQIKPIQESPGDDNEDGNEDDEEEEEGKKMMALMYTLLHMV